jgi:hypothetical protein
MLLGDCLFDKFLLNVSEGLFIYAKFDKSRYTRNFAQILIGSRQVESPPMTLKTVGLSGRLSLLTTSDGEKLLSLS